MTNYPEATDLDDALRTTPNELRRAARLLTRDLTDWTAGEELPTPAMVALGIIGETIQLLDDVWHAIGETKVEGIQVRTAVAETYRQTINDYDRVGLRGGGLDG